MKKDKVSLLKPDRNRNIELILAKIKISNEVLIQSLWSIDRYILKKETIESLLGCIPNEGEKDLYLDKHIDTSMLSDSDLFLIDILQVNDYESRLKALNFQHYYDDWKHDIDTKLQSILKLIDKTYNDESLKLIFLYILAFGNFLNGDS